MNALTRKMVLIVGLAPSPIPLGCDQATDDEFDDRLTEEEDVEDETDELAAPGGAVVGIPEPLTSEMVGLRSSPG